MKAQPVALAPHGVYDRARICEDSCVEYAPVRARIRAHQKAFRARYLAASHEGKRAQGRMP